MCRTLQSQMTEKRMKKRELSEAELEKDIETINQVNMDNQEEMARTKMVSKENKRICSAFWQEQMKLNRKHKEL